mmetsp:Transcript_4178/g.18576  ORF Transcript_4178/g.18576 Transcript_4178/m.18576 type:complete len:203 (-) Transcript_4178:416-1024(-)
MAMRETGTSSEGIMFLATAFCMPERGTAVPAAAGRGAGAAAAGEGAAGAAAAGAAAAAAGAGAEEGTPAFFSTSPAVMRPFMPVPCTVARSTLSFLAIFLAKGVAMMRPSARPCTGAGAAGAGAGAGAAGAGAGAGAAAAGAGGGGAAAAGSGAGGAGAGAAPPAAAALALASAISASVSATKAMGAPTVAISPSGTAMYAR